MDFKLHLSLDSHAQRLHQLICMQSWMTLANVWRTDIEYVNTRVCTYVWFVGNKLEGERPGERVRTF